MTSRKSPESEPRPSIFDRFDNEPYQIASLPKTPASRPRPLISRRAAERQKLWTTVFSTLVLGLTVGGWQWCLNFSRAGAEPWALPLQRIAPKAEATSALPELSALDDAASWSADPDMPKSTIDSAPIQESPVQESPVQQKAQKKSLVSEDPEAAHKRESKASDPAPEPINLRATDSDDGPPFPFAPISTAERVAAFQPSPEKALDDRVALRPSSSEPVSETQPKSVQIERALKLAGRQPIYPAAALKTGLEGEVLLEARIDTRGQVEQIETVESTHPAFERAAHEALADWRFKSASREGRAIADNYRVRFRFDAPERPSQITQARKGDDRPPVKIVSPLPSYPPAAWAANTRGEVKLRVLVDEQGEVGDIEILTGLPNGVNEATIAAVEQWKFKPALQDGKPVPAYEDLTFRF